MANFTAPLTGGIYPEQIYQVIGASGTVTYNAVVYSIGQQFTGVVGARNYTATGSALAQPIANIIEVAIEMPLSQDEKQFTQVLSVEKVSQETTLNQDEKQFNQFVEVDSVTIESLLPVLQSTPVKYDRELLFIDEYTLGDIVGPVVINGGTLTGIVTTDNTPGRFLTKVKGISPTTGTFASNLNGTVLGREIEWDTDIVDTSVLKTLRQIQIRIIREIATQFIFEVLAEDQSTIDIRLHTGVTDYLNETGLTGGFFRRTVNGVFTTSTELIVTGHEATGDQFIRFKLKV